MVRRAPRAGLAARTGRRTRRNANCVTGEDSNYHVRSEPEGRGSGKSARRRCPNLVGHSYCIRVAGQSGYPQRCCLDTLGNTSGCWKQTDDPHREAGPAEGDARRYDVSINLLDICALPVPARDL
jgi:hypothetical protein